MICSNGKIYYTRYFNKDVGYDSDGDGLSDGQEIIIDFKYKIIGPTIDREPPVLYFHMVSNPLSADSDYDGIADGWVDVYGTGQTNDCFPTIKGGYDVPSYVELAIRLSGLSKRHELFEKEDNLDHLHAYADPKLQENECLYSTPIREDTRFSGIGKHFCVFSIAYYDKKDADKVLRKLNFSKQETESILSFLDAISNPLSDPTMSMMVPTWVGYSANIYPFLRDIGVINADEKAREKLDLFLKLYGKENGKTPICVSASIHRISGWDGEVSVYKCYQSRP